MRSWSWRLGILLLAELPLAGCDGFLRVSGEIRDESQHPLTGAQVRLLAPVLPDTGVLLVVDSSGSFSFFQAVTPRELNAELRIDIPGRKPATVRLPVAQRLPYDLRVTLPPESSPRPAEVMNRLQTLPRRS